MAKNKIVMQLIIYFIFLQNIAIATEMGTVILSGQLTDYCYVYESTDTSGNYLLKHSTSYGFELPAGIYTLVVNNTSKTVQVEAGINKFSVGIVDMLGLLTDDCYVYKSTDAARENLLLKHATSYGFSLFPGKYTLIVNNTVKTVDVKSVWDVSGDNKTGIEEAIYILQAIAFNKNDNINLKYAIYALQIASGITEPIDIKTNINEFPLGVVDVSGLLTDYCYVYKSSDAARENLLLKHATSTRPPYIL